MKTNSSYHEAKAFIDEVFRASKDTHEYLLSKLADKIDDWEFEKFKLSLINIFDMTQEETKRYNYIDNLISYAKKLISDDQWKKLKEKTEVIKTRKAITISGDNLTIKYL